MAKALSRAMQEAGIRRSQRSKRVGDYRLDELLFEGPNYQDWTARHAAIDREHARVRIYAIPPAASDEEREALQRAARREYQVLLDVRHEGILKAKAYTDHVHGPALVFEHREGCQRFDHWLAERAAGLDVDTRLHLLRQIAEAVHFAHAKHLVHRALSPQSILVVDPEAPQPRVQVFNWQTGARHALDAGTPGPTTTGASRLDALVEESAWVYMAPEAITERGATGEQLDVFSLGAIAYHLFSGRPPAASLVEMTERLLQEQGLQRLDALWAQHEPGTNPRDRTSRVLDQVAGVDLNPFAVAIARFRLCVAALRAAGVHRLADSPAFEIRVATGDSLLHGPRAGTAGARQEYLDPEHDPLGHVYRTEDASALRAILGRRYHAVVGNPPYITPKDKAVNDEYRKRFGSCYRQYSLAVPFTERFFDLAYTPGTGSAGLVGFVGMITANSFMKREFGKKLIEKFIPGWDLTHVMDTSGAYIPGHGTPTVILFGRHRRPVDPGVRAVMGIRGEPATPEDAARGLVWSAIIEQVDYRVSSNACG